MEEIQETHQMTQDGETGLLPCVQTRDGMLMTSTGEIVWRWKDYFEDILYPTNTPSLEEVQLGNSKEDLPSLELRSQKQLKTFQW